MTRLATKATTRPMPTPMSARPSPRPSTSRTISPGPAPMAMRIPISRVRWLTRYDNTP